MAQARGYKSKLLLDFETTFGQDPGTPAGLLMPINTCTVKGSRAKNSPATITGSRNPAQPFDGNTSVAGGLTVPVDSRAFWYWLRAMFGDPATTGTGPYVHVFAVGDDMPSLVLETQYGTSTPSYSKKNGCRIASLGLKFGGDGELLAEMSVEGAKETVGSVAYHAAATKVSMARLNNFQAALKEGGVSVANCVSLDMDINFGLDTDQSVIATGGIRGDIPEGQLAVTGRAVFLFEDLTLLTKAVNSTESSLEVTITGGTSSILKIAVNELQFEMNTPGIEGPKGIRLELPFVAYHHDHADESVVVFTLTNSDEHAAA